MRQRSSTDLPAPILAHAAMAPLDRCACGAWLLRLSDSDIWHTPNPPPLDHQHVVVDEGGGAL